MSALASSRVLSSDGPDGPDGLAPPANDDGAPAVADGAAADDDASACADAPCDATLCCSVCANGSADASLAADASGVAVLRPALRAELAVSIRAPSRDREGIGVSLVRMR